ncbi:hypothetical protein T01_4376 [Trichinella spiralis]|uniref:Uncharacterized protein n=1 Tax=Trichinella spiralis TaxID=6334 RepID=A0A0V1BP31_TRISP|nr:hypothetical protein T01_4376 [Trichinella spiralis]
MQSYVYISNTSYSGKENDELPFEDSINGYVVVRKNQNFLVKLGKSSLEYLHILEYHLPFNHRRYARVLLRTSCYGGKITEYEGDILQYSVKVSGSQSGRYRPLGVDGTL